ncbi:MAG: hypothetical protein QOF51_766 [Chloroflexota bacterium]|jgi:glycosyltransferase involved in cell wall biosynthesis|nr:hypothetical protein [Chloroflexota bacterium]
MRIAQVAPLVESIPPTKYGGTERVIAALVAELVALGHDVTLYSTGDSRTEAHLVPIVEEALWRSNSKRDATMLHFTELAQVVKDASEYDVIHSHLDYLTFPFARQSPTPFVHTLHGRLDLPELQGLYDEFGDAPVVSISNSQRRPLPQANWLRTVYNGIPVEQVPMGHGKGSYLTFVGRISPEKGVADAIDVALRAGIPLKIAARMPLDGVDNAWVKEDWDYYREHVKPKLDSSLIEFIGEVGDEDKYNLLKDALAMVFPINWPEPFGLVMIESLACGTPVLTRPFGAAPELIEHGRTGFLCHTIDEMVSYLQCIEMIDRWDCRLEAENRFSARVMAEGYLGAYTAVTNGSSTPIRPSLYPIELHRDAVPA